MAKKQECPKCEVGAPAWMTTYGDMVTLLLCLFVMIFATGKAPPQEVRLILSAFSNSLGFFEGGQTLSKGRLEEMGMNLESLPSQTVGRSLSRAKKQAKTIFKPEIKARKIRVTEDERGLVISLVGADYFRPGSALLTPAIESVLVKSAKLMRQLDRFVRVEGHASRGESQALIGFQNADRRERTYRNDWDLSSARSINVVTFLQSYGVKSSLLQVMGYGYHRPLAKVERVDGTPEGDALNRRIDIVVLPYRSPTRSSGESKRGLPPTRIPGTEQRVP